jgi:tRNA(Arg) A34 adenosine deaminase TadA
MIFADQKFMKAAIEEAIKSRENGDYAIGAVIVLNGEILVRATNRSKIEKDATQHSEVVAIRKASQKLNSRYLENCILYTTHEPCPMCAAAAFWAKLAGIVFGAKMEDMADYSIKNGSEEYKWRTIHISAKEILDKGNPKIEIIGEFMRDECKNLFHS